MGDVDQLPFALATAVGPVPASTPLAAAEFACSIQPLFPTVPTLPHHAASPLAQALEGVTGLRLAPPGLVELDGGALDAEAAFAAPLAGTAHEALHTTLGLVRGADDLLGLRVPVLGPITVGLALRSAGVPTDCAVELSTQLVAARAAAALDAALASVPEGVVMVMLNEPGLIGAMHPTFPLSPGEVRAVLDPVVDALDRSTERHRLLIGVHVPGRTDWATIIGSGVSVISTPADGGMLGWAELLADYLERGGRVAWGAVPVDQPLGTGEELLWRRLTATWCELVGEGVDPLLVRTRSFISPADGLAHFGLTQAERVLGLVDSLSTRSRRQAVGARLTLGA
jgi:hypothetical protein